jgi:hypothetical protein
VNAGDEGPSPPAEPSSKSPLGFGSGKFGTPLARMHLANAIGPDPPPAGALELVPVAPVRGVMLDPEPAPLAGADTEVLAPLTVLAIGLEELPPHPASPVFRS